MEALRDMMHWLSARMHGLLDWTESLAQTPYGSAALFLIAFAESSFFPIPPDVLLIALCLGDPEKSLWFALVCAVGSVLGGLGGYGIGYYGGRPVLQRFFDPARIAAVQRYYDRYNAWAIGIAGLTPLPYKLFTVSAGAFAINLRIFTIASVISRSLRFFAVAGLIYFYGEPIKAFIEKYLNILSIVFVVLLVLGFWLVGKGAGRAGRSGAMDEEDAVPEKDTVHEEDTVHEKDAVHEENGAAGESESAVPGEPAAPARGE